MFRGYVQSAFECRTRKPISHRYFPAKKCSLCVASGYIWFQQSFATCFKILQTSHSDNTALVVKLRVCTLCSRWFRCEKSVRVHGWRRILRAEVGDSTETFTPLSVSTDSLWRSWSSAVSLASFPGWFTHIRERFSEDSPPFRAVDNWTGKTKLLRPS